MAVKAPLSHEQPSNNTKLEESMPLWQALENAHFVGYQTSHRLRDQGYETVADLHSATVFELVEIDGIAEPKAKRMKLHLGDLSVIDALGATRISMLEDNGFDPARADEYSVHEIADIPTMGRATAVRLLEACGASV